MAKQVSDIKISGTFGDVCFYRMDGEYYARKKSSLTGKRFRKDKVFEGSRRSAARLGEGSRIAGIVYRSIDKRFRCYGLYCELRRRAIEMLKQGVNEKGVLRELNGRKRKNRKRNSASASKVLRDFGIWKFWDSETHRAARRAGLSVEKRINVWTSGSVGATCEVRTTARARKRKSVRATTLFSMIEDG